MVPTAPASETQQRWPPFGPAVALALLAGAGLCLSLPTLLPWPVFAIAFACGFGVWLRPERWRLGGALSLGFGLAGLHAAATLAQQLPQDLENSERTLSGRVAGLPQSELRRTRFRLRIDDSAAMPPALRGKEVQLSWYDDFDAVAPGPRTALAAGARWRVQARLRAPRGLRNPGGFDSERHALAQRIAATGYVREPGLARALSAPAGIDAERERLSRRIAAQVPQASSKFVRALALGDTQALEDRDWEILRANGLTHLIAISGFHVGLVAGFFALAAGGVWRVLPALSRRLPRQHAAAAAAVAGALAYAAVAGFALPTMRTALMIAVVAAARWSRRSLRGSESLALAAIALLLADPLAVLAPGFWLSFAGVAWLLWCLPPNPGAARRPIRDFLGAQAIATLGLLPLSVALFGQASLTGPIANLVAIPWWSLVIVPLSLLGLGAESLSEGAGGFLWRMAARAFDASWPWFEALSDTGMAAYWLPEAAWYALPLALLGAFWLLLPRGVPAKPLALLLWLPLFWPQRGLPKFGGADLTTIDVGQGLSVLVRTADHALLYDMGPAVRDGYDAGERAVLPMLRAMGVHKLDRIVVSHADNDHAGGWETVRRAVPVADALAPDGSQVPNTRPCLTGADWRWDGVRFRILHPPPDFPYLGNEASCVLRIETEHSAALLTGDVGEVIERRLLRESPAAVRADAVWVAHHGSRGSSDPDFVAATGARYALVSAGYANRFGHPNREVAERWRRAGAEVATTFEDGALQVRLTADGITLAARRRQVPRLWDATRRRERVSYRQD